MAFCLTKETKQKFIEALRTREIDPARLSEMTSAERRTFLEKFVGKDNGIQVNALFESKLLLKNQKAGWISWAKKVGGMTTEAKRDLISRIERMQNVLNPKEEEQFLNDLASTRLGVNVTEKEAKSIADLSINIDKAKASQKPDLTFATEVERLSYGRAKINLINYVNDLKDKARTISKNPIDIVSTIAGNAKSIKASMDNSAIFRQGWKTLWTNPIIWTKNALKTFKDIVRTFGGKPVMDELNADIISRPTYDMMRKAKLAVGNIEEAFPGTVVEKIPILNRLYKSSENAFVGFVQKTRADVFDKYIQIAQKSGVELTEKELKAIGSMVNSLTGRGNFGKYEGAGVDLVNNVFFSPRFLKSQVDTLGHVISGAGGSNFVRKQAAMNLLKVVGGTAGVLAVAHAINPKSVETDSRSADFGKIKIGNTRFDVTGGIAPLVVLALRLITMSSKSSTTGKITPLNSGDFGSATGKDVVYNFLENKLSPAASVLKQLAEGEDFDGNKPTPFGLLSDLFMPLSISTFNELKNDPNSADLFLSMIAESLGIGTNTYGQLKKEWIQNPTKAQQGFLDEVGETKFKEANKNFNTEYDKWFSQTLKSDAYRNLSSDAKATLITNAKSNIQDKIFEEYGFKYKTLEKTSGEKKESEKVKSLTPYQKKKSSSSPFRTKF